MNAVLASIGVLRHGINIARVNDEQLPNWKITQSAPRPLAGFCVPNTSFMIYFTLSQHTQRSLYYRTLLLAAHVRRSDEAIGRDDRSANRYGRKGSPSVARASSLAVDVQ